MLIKPDLDQFETVRTTVSLPATLVERTRIFIERGLIPNRNAAIAAALEYFLDEMERQDIDRAINSMATDEAYDQLGEDLDSEFAASDWESLLEAEPGA